MTKAKNCAYARRALQTAFFAGIAASAIAEPPPGIGVLAPTDDPALSPEAGSGLLPSFGTDPFDMDWYTIDGGGATYLTGGTYELGATLGQPDAGTLSDGSVFEFAGGFWGGVNAPITCYANCDGSTTDPALTAADFICFLNRFRAADPYANCDGSVTPLVFSANDFSCFLNKFRAGCP